MAVLRFNESEEIMDYITLFVSVLICFPEVGTIKFDRETQRIGLTFILQNKKTERTEEDEALEKALASIENSLTSYHRMLNKKIPQFEYEVRRYVYDEYTVLEVARDVATVTRAEISFLIELFRINFIDRLLMETVDPNIMDDFGWYDDNHQDLFSDKNKVAFGDDRMSKQVLACREAGRVLVFSS